MRLAIYWRFRATDFPYSLTTSLADLLPANSYIKYYYGPRQYIYTFIQRRKLFCKGQSHEIFCFSFFSWIIFIQAPENNIRIIVNFFTNILKSRCTTGINDTLVNLPPILMVSLIPVVIILGTISECLHLKMNLKKNVSILLTLLPKGVQNKIFKLFWLKIFYWRYTFSCEYLREFYLKKSKRPPFGILRGLGETDSWKNLKLKISWNSPCNSSL